MACAPFSVLEITDGTTLVNLLAERSGFCCTDWLPSIAEGKGGGVWRDSPLSGGRRLVIRKLGNVIERFELQVRNWNPDQLIRDTQKLRRLLEKAVSYWTSRWQDEPVWIVAQSPLEENLRYALVQDYSTPDDEYPYGQPFWPQIGSAAMDNFALLLERGHWTENEPGTGTAVECSAVEAYDGRNLGNVDDGGVRDPTTADEVYIANKHNEANLTDVYHYDTTGPAWSANLMDAALPFAFLPAVPAVGDIAYFGIDTTVSDSGPFCSLVFDIGTVQVDLTITWEYWNGAWVALTIQDNTDADGALTGEPFDTLSVNSVHWIQPSDWVTTAVNAITGYWVRARVTAIGGAPVPPQQQNRDIYSIVWPYTEIQSSQVGGDIRALLEAKINNESNKDAGGLTLLGTRMIMGLRSITRGSLYTAYLNCSDEQVPAGLTVTVGGATTFVDYVQSPTGRVARYNPPGVDGLAFRVDFTFTPALAVQFYGTYHAFIRCTQSGGASGDFTVRLTSYFPTSTTHDEVTVNGTVAFEVLDMGQVTFPPDVVADNEIVSRGLISILASNANASPGDLYFIDLILMPVDECAIEAVYQIGSETLERERFLDIDSVVILKRNIRTVIKRKVDDTIGATWQTIANSPALLQANAQQRLWFFAMTHSGAWPSTLWGSLPEIGHSLQLNRNARYLSMRGDR